MLMSSFQYCFLLFSAKTTSLIPRGSSSCMLSLLCVFLPEMVLLLLDKIVHSKMQLHMCELVCAAPMCLDAFLAIELWRTKCRQETRSYNVQEVRNIMMMMASPLTVLPVTGTVLQILCMAPSSFRVHPRQFSYGRYLSEHTRSYVINTTFMCRTVS